MPVYRFTDMAAAYVFSIFYELKFDEYAGAMLESCFFGGRIIHQSLGRSSSFFLDSRLGTIPSKRMGLSLTWFYQC